MSLQRVSFDRRWLFVGVGGALVVAAWLTHDSWKSISDEGLAKLQRVVSRQPGPDGKSSSDDGHSADEHAGHDHAGHNEASSVELSDQARRNIGLNVGDIQLGTFVRKITVPGIVVERRGLTKTQVVAPLTGVVTKVHVIEGEALRPGRPLFDLRMTHEDLLQTQVEFLKMLEELDVVNREIDRIRPVVEKGAVPQKTLLDRQYEQQKLNAGLRSQRESLLLHGLTSEQVEEISNERTLRSNLTIYVPELASAAEPQTRTALRPKKGEGNLNAAPENSSKTVDRLFVVNALNVESGRLVTAGDPLLTIADYSELYAEGNAFEQDGQLVADALRNGWPVTAIVENHTAAGTTVPNLPILFLSDEVDPASRTLHFFMKLPNERIRDESADGHRFINWRFKPGQRTHLRVPVEKWPDRIVLPADAVAQDGPESYVFQENGDHFDRRPVQVEYRDLESVVVAQDGSLFPGDRVALSGAQQMLMALKNKSGGGVDPHAGHNH